MQEEIKKSAWEDGMKGIECIELRKFITEYKQKNEKNEFKPVAVGKYGIRTRESIYSKELAKDYSKNKIIFKNTLTVGMGSRQIDIGILTDDVIYSVSPAYHTYKISGINADYLRYCLMCRNEDMFKRFVKRGSRQGKSIDLKRWLEYEIPVYDVCNQEKIVLKLNKVTNVISMRKQQLQKLDELIQARFVEMFGGLHNSKLYPYVSIETFTDVTSGGTPNRNTKEYWENGNIRWVKTTELHNNFITDTEEYITRKGIDNSSAKVIPAHSILVAMYGQGKTRGMTGYLLKECTTNQACACILPCKRVDQKYLWYYMILSYDKLRGMAKGGNQPNLNIGIIKRFQVLVPPIELQSQFADFVNQVNKSKVEIQQALEKTQLLFDSLMQQYFG